MPRALYLEGPALFSVDGLVVSMDVLSARKPFSFERTETATVKAVASSDTRNTVVLRATKESQKERGFLAASVPTSSSGGVTINSFPFGFQVFLNSHYMSGFRFQFG